MSRHPKPHSQQVDDPKPVVTGVDEGTADATVITTRQGNQIVDVTVEPAPAPVTPRYSREGVLLNPSESVVNAVGVVTAK